MIAVVEFEAGAVRFAGTNHGLEKEGIESFGRLSDGWDGALHKPYPHSDTLL